MNKEGLQMAKTDFFGPELRMLAIALFMLGVLGPNYFVQKAYSASPTVTPTQGKALIIFVRDFSSDASLVDYRHSPVFEIKSDNSEPNLVGNLSVKTKIRYEVDPGKHLFMVVGENTDFMTADVLPNRAYHVLVLARLGIGRTARLTKFSMTDGLLKARDTDARNVWFSQGE